MGGFLVKINLKFSFSFVRNAVTCERKFKFQFPISYDLKNAKLPWQCSFNHHSNYCIDSCLLYEIKNEWTNELTKVCNEPSNERTSEWVSKWMNKKLLTSCWRSLVSFLKIPSPIEVEFVLFLLYHCHWQSYCCLPRASATENSTGQLNSLSQTERLFL